MPSEKEKRDKRQYLTLRRIKWATIILPVVILASLDWLRHNVFYVPLHSLSGFVITYAALAIGIAFFSNAIFGLIDRLQRQSNARSRRLEALNDIAKVSATGSGLDDILRKSLDIIVSSMKIDSGLICIVDSEKEEHLLICHSGLSPSAADRIQKRKLRDDPVGLAAVRTGQPVIIERACDDVRVSEVATREGIKSLVSTPLKFEGGVNGILAIATRTERNFTEGEREFLDGIGGQLGMVIRNATLYEQTRLQNQELSALLTVSKVATSSFDLDEVLAGALDTVIEVTSSEAAEIWLAENDENLTLKCHRGEHPEAFLEQTQFHIGDGIPGMIAQRRKPFILHDLPSDGRLLRQKVVEAGFQTFAALPLIYQDKLVGVLAVAALSADAIKGEHELSMLEGIGEWLALAIENTRLYQQVQDVAILQERERLAREMHDGMAQLLGYINTQTIAVRKFLSDNRLTEALEELTKMEEIARELYADIREGILELRTAAQRGDGLLPVLRKYIDRYTELFGIKVEVKELPGTENAKLAPSAEIQLMRIIQEALTNVRKHAETTSATVMFEGNGAELCITIADNGRGFEDSPLPPARRPRFGLHTMRERAEAVGGSLNIDTVLGQGTKVEVSIPTLPRDNKE